MFVCEWDDFDLISAQFLKYIYKVVPKQANVVVLVALLLMIVMVLFDVGQLMMMVMMGVGKVVGRRKSEPVVGVGGHATSAAAATGAATRQVARGHLS